RPRRVSSQEKKKKKKNTDAAPPPPPPPPPPPQRDSFLHTLAAEEQTIAQRFYFQTDRERFINAHGVLRAILGLYLDRAPKCLSFCYSSYGKPALTRESGG